MNLRAHQNTDASFTLYHNEVAFLDLRNQFGVWQVVSHEVDHDTQAWRRVLTSLLIDARGIEFKQTDVELNEMLANVRRVLIARVEQEQEDTDYLAMLDERADALFRQQDAIDCRMGA